MAKRLPTSVTCVAIDLTAAGFDGDKIRPGVTPALEALRDFETQDGRELQLYALVAWGSGTSFERFDGDLLAFLSEWDLDRFFEPIDERVLAYDRAQSPLGVVLQQAGIANEQLLVITGSAEEEANVESLGGTVLRWGPAMEPGVDFDDWSKVPLLVARRVGSEESFNLTRAVAARVGALYDVEVSDARYVDEHTVALRGRKWVSLSDKALGALDGVAVQLPVDGVVTLDDHGDVEGLEAASPAEGAVEEATHYVHTLVESGELAEADDASETPYTVETDERGRRRLKRRHFTGKAR